MATEQSDGALAKVIHWAMSVDRDEVCGRADALRDESPRASRAELAARVYDRTAWKAAALGFASGLPSNPAVAVPAAIAEGGAVLRMQLHAAATVAVLHEPDFLDTPDAQYELLVPIFGASFASQALGGLGVRGAQGVTRAVVKKHLSKQALKAFKRFLLKWFGLKVTQRGLLTKTLPVVGGLIGGTWNLVEVKLMKGRVVGWFEGRAL